MIIAGLLRTAVLLACAWGIVPLVADAADPAAGVVDPAQGELDRYGGYRKIKAPGGATGFFRVEKIGARWVFVTPEGHPFWLRAVYGVNWAGGGYQAITRQKYPDWSFPLHAVNRLRRWGFNALGEVTHLKIYPVGTYGSADGNAARMPFIINLNATLYAFRAGQVKNLYAGVDLKINPGFWVGGFPDVFDPKFASFVETFAQDKHRVYNGAVALNASPWLIGVTTDESDYTTGFGPGPDAWQSQGKIHAHVGWVVAVTAPTQTSSRLSGFTATFADPVIYTKLAWRDYLRGKYGSIAALNTAWGATYTTWDSDGGWPNGRGLMDEGGRGAWIGKDARVMSQPPAVTADLDAFLEILADKYFGVYADKLRHHLPNHLVFSPATLQAGTRLPILRAAGRHLDVIQGSGVPLGPSYPLYRRAYEVSGRPIFLWTTFTAQADAGLVKQDLRGWNPYYNKQTQEERGRAYLQEISNLAALRAGNGDHFIVGIDWWEWVDKISQGENMNFGLVSQRDNAYDGKEAVVARGTDPGGYSTGGEDKDYGDFLSSVVQAHRLLDETLKTELSNLPASAGPGRRP